MAEHEMPSTPPTPKILLMTAKEKRAYVIDVVTHLAQLEANPTPDAFTTEWKELVEDGVEQMWAFLEEFIKQEGLT